MAYLYQTRFLLSSTVCFLLFSDVLRHRSVSSWWGVNLLYSMLKGNLDDMGVSEDRFYVYGLYDPRDGELRYVGLRKGNLGPRLNLHICDARKGKKRYSCHWIRQVLDAGFKPLICELQQFNNFEDTKAAEVYWIKFFREQGCRLTNLTDGGEGTVGWVPDEEFRRKVSVRMKGHKRSPESIEKVAAAHRGMKRTGEALERMRAATKKIIQSPEWRLAQRIGHGGKPELDPAVLESFGSGMNMKSIAAKFDISRGSVRKILIAAGVSFEGRRRGDVGAKSVATSDGRIFRSIQDCSKALGVYESTIDRALKRGHVMRASGLSVKYVEATNG